MTAIGTIKDTGPGDSVATSVAIAQPTTAAQGLPPVDVLTDCNWSDTVKQASSVYIHGQMTVSYTGAVPQTVLLNDDKVSLITDAEPADSSLVAFSSPSGAGWTDCAGDANVWNTTMQPGQTLHVDFWIGYSNLITNTSPTFTAAEKTAFQSFIYALPTDLFGPGRNGKLSFSGPGAASCDNYTGDTSKRLLLYARPPVTYQQVASNLTTTVRCVPTN